MTAPVIDAANPKRLRLHEAIRTVMERHGFKHDQLADALFVSVETLTWWRWRKNYGAWTLFQLWVRGPFEAADLAGEIIQELYP